MAGSVSGVVPVSERGRERACDGERGQHGISNDPEHITAHRFHDHHARNARPL